MTTTTLQPTTIYCPVCGYGYVHGLPGEAELHAYHALWTALRYPQPDRRFATYAGDVRVDKKSPKWLHREVHKRAQALGSRRLTPRECARLQGLDDNYVLPANVIEGYDLVGDGVAVPVVRFLAEHIVEPILAANVLAR